MTKILSIIIPSCNMEKYLGQCLDSLLVPSINDIEILIINDGSKDRTSEIAHGYEQQYPQSIRVIDKSNGHYGSCINRGVKEATGKYVKILDADDSFDSEVFEKFIIFLKNTDVDLVLSNYCIVNETRIVTQYRPFVSAKEGEGSYSFNDVMDILTSQHMAMHSVSYRREMLLNMNYKQTEGVAYTDQEWIFEPMTKVERVAIFPFHLYKYLVGRVGQSVSANIICKNMEVQLRLLIKRVQLFSTFKDSISNAHYKYLKGRLTYALTNTYRTLLLRTGFHGLHPLLSELDECIMQSSPEIYSELANLRIKSWLPIYFVKHWRKTKH